MVAQRKMAGMNLEAMLAARCVAEGAA